MIFVTDIWFVSLGSIPVEAADGGASEYRIIHMSFSIPLFVSVSSYDHGYDSGYDALFCSRDDSRFVCAFWHAFSIYFFPFEHAKRHDRLFPSLGLTPPAS